MADSGGELSPPKKIDSREEKLRLVRERQAEERQRRLEELKRHALEAQQFREQKEIERRKRMEDSRQKENERRSQVEERKRQIWEAEKERREAIVRKNQEREARIDAKRKNERSSIVFAFGSSTPRMLETTDSHCFWGPRRATSTANLMLFPTATPTVPLSRRTSERELEPKKRASSAGGLYRNPGDLMSASMYEVFHWDSQPAKPRLSLAPQTDPSLSVIDAPAQSVPQTPVHPKPFAKPKGDAEENTIGSTVNLRAARRKTDLMPTIPSPRDGIISSRPASGSRSLARTPGDMTPSRPGSVLSQYSVTSASNPIPRLRQTPRRPRPLSIHVTGITKDKERILSPEERPKPKEAKENKVSKPSAVKNLSVTKKQNQKKNEEIKKMQTKTSENNKDTIENNLVVINKVNENNVTENKREQNTEDIKAASKVDTAVENSTQSEPKNPVQPVSNDSTMENTIEKPKETPSEVSEPAEDESAKGSTASRSKITTEEEAKAALAERRRLAREQAEREAEAERLRLEMEAQKETERIRKEEEEQRLAEEEQLRLLEEARRMEEVRLMQAIEEAKKREEEEKERRQQEELARLEKEEQERKAREEAEKQRIEMTERLKREEEERQARRKRVEAIMKRTRNNPANPISKAECEKGEEDGAEHEKDESKGNLEAFLNNERLSAERSLINGQSSSEHLKENLDNNKVSETADKLQSNGVVGLSNTGLASEDCINSVTPLIAFQGKTKETPVAANYMALINANDRSVESFIRTTKSRFIMFAGEYVKKIERASAINTKLVFLRRMEERVRFSTGDSQSQTIEDFGAALHLMRSDLEHLRSVFMAVENGDLGLLKSLGIKDSELGDVRFFLEKLVNTGFLD